MIQIIQGDCRSVLTTLPEQSVQCVVTSPPYWGLRDYGHSEQIGLEETPQAYVENMRQVFKEVWRVLRNDGTVWLNLGASYFGSGQGGNPANSPHQKQKTNRGSFSYDKRPSQSHVGALACGSDGKGLQGSMVIDSACCDLCDGCRAVLLMDSGCIDQRTSQFLPHHAQTSRDNAHSDSEVIIVGVSPLSSQASTNPLSSLQLPASCRHCANCGACLSVLRSSSRDASLCVRKGLYKDGISQRESDGHNHGTDALVKAYPYLSTPSLNFKPKDLVNIPFYVAEALRADGWYLRSDIIWHKPNPMPESVTDRPTRSHEYIFLLTKSARYYYDYEAIKEPYSENTIPRMERGVSDNHKNLNGAPGQPPHTLSQPRLHSKYRGQATKDYESHNAQNPSDTKRRVEEAILNGTGANKRSVWSVTTASYADAHFATFPPDLIKPCILAGTKPGDTVLDPFGGSGTTGMVALELGRKAILIELNPDYCELAQQRCNVTPGLPLV